LAAEGVSWVAFGSAFCDSEGVAQHETPGARPSADVSPKLDNKYFEGTFAGAMGLRYTDVTADRVCGEWVVEPYLHQIAGIQHGGVYCTVIESLASLGAGVWFHDRGTVVGVNNNTDFLHAVSEGTLFGEATPVHRGNLQQLWQVVITDEQDRVVARGQVRLQNLPYHG
jgi:1,4-dihydroxy-2-naphthoyl-CoA hydrolase